MPRNPVYLNNEGTTIHLTVDDTTSITVEPHSKNDMFNRTLAGEFGTIAPYVISEGDGIVTPLTSCSSLQAKLALHQFGLLEQTEALIASMDIATRLVWADAGTFLRTSPLLNSLSVYVTWPDGSALTSDDLDELFAVAKTIEV